MGRHFMGIPAPCHQSRFLINDCLKTCSTSLTATGKKQGGAYGISPHKVRSYGSSPSLPRETSESTEVPH